MSINQTLLDRLWANNQAAAAVDAVLLLNAAADNLRLLGMQEQAALVDQVVALVETRKLKE